jgi:hypothetical protein
MPLDFRTEEEIEENKYNSSPTGSLRTNVGKVDPTHIAPEFIMEMARVFTENEKKYPKFNYAKGQNICMSMASLMRHYIAFMNGEDKDPDDGCSHLAKIAINALITWCTMEYHLEKYPELDDRFRRVLGLEE